MKKIHEKKVLERSLFFILLLGGAFLTGCSQNGNSEEETALLQKMSEAESAYFQNEKDFYTDAEEEEPFLSRKEISNIDENGHQSVSSIYIYDENIPAFLWTKRIMVSAALRRGNRIRSERQ